MTKLFAAALISVWLAIPAIAQSAVTVDIPFTFYVGGTKLPAGYYEIATTGRVVRITNLATRSKAAAFSPVSITRRHGAEQVGGLVFHAYGQDLFLAEMWPMGSLSGLSVPKSDFQSELTRKKQSIRIVSQSVSNH